MPKKTPQLIAISAPVEITAAEGESTGPAKFTSTFYTGGALEINGWDLPVVVDLAGLEEGKVLVANLDHDSSKRVGNFAVTNDGKSLVANGTASAATPARDEVINSARDGYQWQASLEVRPKEVETVKAGKTVEVNGQSFEGPLYVTRKGTLKGFGFVSHGADDNTTASIAASAATKEKAMKAEVKTWVKAMLPSIEIEALSAEEVTNLEAQYAGLHPKKITAAPKLGEGLEAKREEVSRIDAITEIALTACDRRPYDIDAIKGLAEQAIEGKWGVDKFRLELLEASLPPAHTVFRTRKDERMNGKVVEAALCMSGRYSNLEKDFDEQTLEAAHKHFRNGIGLKQLFLMAAEANGYKAGYGDVSIEVQRAAFGMLGGNRQINAAGGFSTLSISNIIAATANKFLMEGWMAVDMTFMRIAAIRPVRNFQQVTTVSLTGGLQFEKLGPTGEIKHGTLADLTYTNQADTYAAMLAITRKDIINDDVGALTSAPRRLGRGAALKLNDIGWTEFLDNSDFFKSGNNNVSTGAGSALGAADGAGINAAEVKFMNQTDPDGKPLGVMPAIMLVPPTLKNTAARWMGSQLFVGSTGLGDGNIFGGRYRVESSPYMESSTYTGNSTAAWYLIADPKDLATIEIAALNGRVEPVVETADADFNTLGVQMRGYSDVGVNLQEYRAGVRSAGS